MFMYQLGHPVHVMFMAARVDNPWVVSVFDKLREVTEATSPGVHHSVYRVPSFIRNLKPERFDCQLLPLGLYNREFKSETSIHNLKLEVLSIFLKHFKSLGKDGWNTFRQEITTPPRSEFRFKDFYHDFPSESFRTPEAIQSMLTIDAVFIMSILCTKLDLPSNNELFRGDLHQIFSRGSVQNQLDVFLVDIWLFENQIPLFLLKNIFTTMTKEDSAHKFDNLITSIVLNLASDCDLPCDLPIDPESCVNHNLFERCDHLLACLLEVVRMDSSPSTGQGNFEHRYFRLLKMVFNSQQTLPAHVVKKVLRAATGRNAYHGRRSLPTVSQLQKAGIRVRGIPRNATYIQFVTSTFRLKGTLYLPQVVFDDDSVKIMHNMCVYEQLILSPEKRKFISYFWLLDDLVNTEEDVRLLGEGNQPVIIQMNLGDNKRVADTINSMLYNISVYVSLEQQEVIDQMLVWYKARWRHQLTHFIDRFVTAPWILMSLVAASILLFATVLQTVYAVLSFYHGR